jgi:2-phosphoglycolate phosphatase
MSNDPRAVLFDFDGTLADSYAAITSSVNHVRAAHGLTPLPEAEVRHHVGHGMPYLLAHTVSGCNQAVDQARYHAHHPSVMKALTRLLPGAADVLAALNSAGKKIGVCSNKPREFTHELLAHLGVASLIDVVLGPEDVPRPKPAPDMLRAGLERLGVAPSEALYIGDMVVDIETARAAGVTVWVVVTGSDERAALEAAKPERLCNSLSEVQQALAQR